MLLKFISCDTAVPNRPTNPDNYRPLVAARVRRHPHAVSQCRAGLSQGTDRTMMLHAKGETPWGVFLLRAYFRRVICILY